MTAANMLEFYKTDEIRINHKLSNEVLTHIVPEPYYGPFHDMKEEDVLVLLLNPGTGDENIYLDDWNDQIRSRYQSFWSRKEYFAFDEDLKSRSNWREVCKNQTAQIINHDGFVFDFLHTMEFFPFRSKKDTLTAAFKNAWVNHYPEGEIQFQALRDIAINKMVKYILAPSFAWQLFFEKHGIQPEKEMILRKSTSKSTRGYSFNLALYRFPEGGTPVLFCRTAQPGMGLPTNQSALRVMRIWLGIEEGDIPSQDEHYFYIKK
ncbi:hypothetical protein [Paenibacillus odorifer]|uniref:hypothetical protein n=1 Tax=Paenibacillus odorifer TaxID=189426 RepID=UPI000BA0A971|nr:hypothetical protein [Paenibacillus odorifer]OZQ62753.1 hypothetical protein CA596_29770 [Paenibacillus odorifer]